MRGLGILAWQMVGGQWTELVQGYVWIQRRMHRGHGEFGGRGTDQV